MRFMLWECDRCRHTDQTDDVPGDGLPPHGWKIYPFNLGGKMVETHVCPDCLQQAATPPSGVPFAQYMGAQIREALARDA